MIGVRSRPLVWGFIAVAAVSLTQAEEERVGSDTCEICHDTSSWFGTDGRHARWVWSR